jgi:methanogen homocitrate synthase
MKTAALSRLLSDDIDATVDAGVDMVSLFLGGSDVHLQHKYGFTEADALPKIEQAIARVRQRGGRAAFTIEDGSRTPLPRMVRMFQVAVDAGADYLVLADTVGVLTPPSSKQILRILSSLFPRPFGLHFHNDLGLALANSLAGLEGGARMVHVTVNGVGERAGNTCLEELAVVLKLKYERDLGFNLSTLSHLSELVHKASGTRAPEHKAIVGKWCFSHESGIHVAGILTHQETYQPYPPQTIGRHHEIVFGKHSGNQSVSYLASQHGIQLSESDRKEILDRIKRSAESKQGTVTEEQIVSWIQTTGRGK